MDPALLPALDADLIGGAIGAVHRVADLFGSGHAGAMQQLIAHHLDPQHLSLQHLDPQQLGPQHLAAGGPDAAPASPTAADGGIQLAEAKPPADADKIKGEDLKKIKVTQVGKDAATDFSLVAIILRADIVVKIVIAILALASVWSWAVIFDKTMLLRRMRKRANRFEDEFWSGGSVDDLYERVSQRKTNPMAALFMAAMREWRKSNPPERPAGELNVRGGVQERIDRAMQISITREMAQMEKHVGLLATIGATAPFIGLFGTVWGIMNSFREIAVQKNTNLATVAPGISEALFATALGLVAAIPAVIAYNKLTNDLDRFAQRLEGFSGEFSGIVSRQIEGSGR